MKNKYYIVNEVDRPCEDLIAEKMGDGLLYYIDPRKRPHYPGMSPNYATPLEDFGFELKEKGGELVGELKFEQKAKYSNKTFKEWVGKSRPWQGSTNFKIKLF